MNNIFDTIYSLVIEYENREITLIELKEQIDSLEEED